MIGTTHIIEKDLFDIADRLKSVDSGYYIVYSYPKHRYEVHHNEQRGSSLAFVVPFDRLDCRTVEYARRTGRERSIEFIAEIEKENERRQRREMETTAKKVLQAI